LTAVCVPVHLVVQVTLLVLVDGKYLIPSLKRNSKRVDKGDVKTALETILSIPRRNLEVTLVSLLWVFLILYCHNS
jgi:hypothetical protein